MLKITFDSRRAAGKYLGPLLAEVVPNRSAIVLAHGNRAIPVAAEICRKMSADIDIMGGSVISVSEPESRVVAAITSTGIPYIYLDLRALPPNYETMIRRLARFEQKRLIKQEKAFRRGRIRSELTGKDVIIVDDGKNAGHLHAAIATVKAEYPASISLALPFATLRDLDNVRGLVNHLVCGQVISAADETHWFYQKDGVLSDLDLKYELWEIWQKAPYPVLPRKRALSPQRDTSASAQSRTETIPERQWGSFCHSLTEECFGWRTHIKQLEMTDPSSLLTAKPFISNIRTDDAPLIDISYCQTADQYRVHFLAEKTPDYVVINSPCKMTLLKSEQDRKTLRIDTDGAKTFYVQLVHKRVMGNYNQHRAVLLPSAFSKHSRTSA